MCDEEELEEGTIIAEKKTVMVETYILVEHDLFITVHLLQVKFNEVATQCKHVIIHIMFSVPVSLSSSLPLVIKLVNLQVL